MTRIQIDWFGNEAKASVKNGAEIGLWRAAQHVLTEANRTVPWDQGPLMRSGGTDLDRGNLEASVYYDTPYARRQHEELGWRHKPGKRAKWLELTLQEQAHTVRQIMIQAMRDRLS